MNISDALIFKRTRGRPKNGSKSTIIDQLVQATDQLLRDFNHFDLTEQRIADRAGVDKKMIHYYFGDKNGLLFEVIARRMDEVMEKWKDFDAIDPTSQDVTRQIIKILVVAHYAKPWVEKTMASEAARSGSIINELFLKNYGSHEIGPLPLRRLIHRLIECGTYDSRLNVEDAASSIFFMITGPLMLTSISSDPSTALDKYKTNCWIEHISVLFDRQFRAADTNSSN